MYTGFGYRSNCNIYWFLRLAPDIIARETRKASMSADIGQVEARQKNYYDRIAEKYDQHYHNKYAIEYRHGIYEGILRGMNIDNMYVLDAMCGGGENTSFFLKHGARVVGQDISEEQCRIYHARYPSCLVFCSSILKADFKDSVFDLVVVESLHHLHPYLNEGLNEILRILKPGGLLLLWEPSARSLMDFLRKLWYKYDAEFFESNEASIDLDEILREYRGRFTLVKKQFGGNVAYLLVATSMIFRIPPKLVKYYASFLMTIEKYIRLVQGRPFSCWVLALLQKNANGAIAAINDAGASR